MGFLVLLYLLLEFLFLLSFLLQCLIHWLRKCEVQNHCLLFLDAVNIASVAIIISICFSMGKESITDWRTIIIAILSTAFTFGYKKINSAFIVLGSSLFGYLLTYV
ncbi:chromate transporter [Flavobacterium omnivorum]|uniref:chromate transporter n=1 Tax=Flavobacterium omnivorum TaxID=178355 RepID=UPI00373FDC5D